MTTQTPHSQVDQQSLQSTLIQIRERALKIEQLSEKNLLPVEFFKLFLNEITAAMAACGGAVWIQSSDEKLHLLARTGDETKDLLERLSSWDQHEELLQNTIEDAKSIVSPPQKVDPQGENANPEEKLLLMIPLSNKDVTLGVVEIFQRPNNSPEIRKGYIRFAEQMARLASRYLSNRKLRDLQDKQAIWNIADEFFQNVHSSLDVKETCYIIANELCRLLEADRVTVTTKKGKKSTVEAISNLTHCDQRSNTVRQLLKLSQTVSETGLELNYNGDLKDVPKEYQSIFESFLDQSDANSIQILPLCETKNLYTGGTVQTELVGTIIIERNITEESSKEYDSRMSVLQSHSTLALSRALEHENLIFYPICKSLEKVKSIRNLKNNTRFQMLMSMLTVTLIFLWILPTEFTFVSPGTLKPDHQRDVFATSDGVIDSLLVQNGEKVSRGQVLAILENRELMMEKKSIEGELASVQESLSAAKMNLFNNRKITSFEQDQLHAQVKQFTRTEASLLKKLEIFEDKIESLTLKSPIDGQIVTWNVNELLGHRPVSKGQRLMSIANRDDEWQVELNVKEDDLGYLQKATKEMEEIKVTFTMATHPGEVYEGIVTNVHQQTFEDKDGKKFVQVKVKVQSEDLPPLYTGAAIQGKIHCGKQALGFVWFHDVIEFMENKVLFML